MLDASIPGVQPIFSSDSLRLGLVASLMLQCRIAQVTRFDRKHYFYADLPLGYQITQHYAPLASGGSVTVKQKDPASRTFEVGIKQIQLEQDTARSTQDPASDALLANLNRAGSALIEIVTEPDMRSPEEASGFVRKLQSLLRHAGVSDGNMEEGSLRCDVNVSVEAEDGSRKSNRCEIKNVNGLGNIERAISSEVVRHIELLSQGEAVPTETRGYDVSRAETFYLRSKEDAPDYRYLPDPDIPPLHIPPAVIESLRGLLPSSPEEIVRMLNSEYGVNERDSHILAAMGEGENLYQAGSAFRFFRQAMSRSKHTTGPAIASWIINELNGALGKARIPWAQCPLSPEDLALLVDAVGANLVKRSAAKSALTAFIEDAVSGREPVMEAVLSASQKVEGDYPLSESALAEELVRDMPQEVAAVRAGKVRTLKAMVGEGMRRSKRRADARALQAELETLIGVAPK